MDHDLHSESMDSVGLDFSPLVLAWHERFGAASRALLRRAAAQEFLAEPEQALSAVCQRVERAHCARYGLAALATELTDERERDGAARDERSLLSYARKWERAIERLQRAQPARWSVAGLSADEVRDELTLRLLELVRDEAARLLGQPGKAWGLVVVQRRLGELRRSFRLPITPVDFHGLAVNERSPNQEERWLELERDACLAEAARRARQQLSRPQQRWLAALTQAAERGEFFETSAALNLSAASRLLGKHRSSAQRAYQELRERFTSELKRVS